jgi:hypothetical protein
MEVGVGRVYRLRKTDMLCLYTLGSVTSLDSAISVTTSQLALAVHSLSEGL